MIQLYWGNERIVTARSFVRMLARITTIALLACLPALGLVGLAACSKDSTEPEGSSDGASGKPAAATQAQSNAADGGGTASSGQPAAASASSGAASQSSASGAGGAGKDSAGGQPAGAAGDGGAAGKPSAQAFVPPGDLTQDIAAGLASGMCTALSECLGASGLRSLVGRESCQERFGASYAQSAFALLEDSVARQRVAVHSELLEQCYKDTAALGCNVQRERSPSSCSRAIEGLVAAGGTCSSGWDCAEDTFCAEGTCPRSCVARVAAGAACSSDNDCVSGLLCVGQKCVAPAQAGQSCGGKTGVPCLLGTACVGSTDDAAGSCRANSEILVAELGASCDLNTVYCREGLSCGFNGGALSCQDPVSSGEKCHLAAPAQCPIEEFCNAKSIDQEGRCQVLPRAGETCVLEGECAAGHVCVAEAGKPVCRALRNLDESCTQPGECRSGRCVDTHCAVGVVCE